MRIFKSAFESIQGKKPEEDNKQQSKGSFYIDEQFMTPEFLYKQNQQGTQKKLTKQFFLALSAVEHKFNSAPVKQINLVDQLVGMYQECVQQYDTMMDPIKYYFVDKIRTIVSQADKFTQREPKSLQSSEKRIQHIQPMTNEVSYFKDFEDFTDRIDKPTEYATPKAEEQYQHDTKLVNQLQSLIEEGDTKLQKEIILKNHESPKLKHESPIQTIQKATAIMHEIEEIAQHFKPTVEVKKKSPKVEFRQTNNETPVANFLLDETKKVEENVVEVQLQNQQKSIQDRLLARQRSQKKKDI